MFSNSCHCEERSDDVSSIARKATEEAIQLDCNESGSLGGRARHSQLSALSYQLLRRSRRGFTIIELLVAAGITLGIAGFIAIIVLNVSTTWTRAGNRLSADAQARIVLDQLQLDLQGAMFRDDGNVWLAANVVDNTGNAPGLWTEAVRNPKPSGAGANGSVNLNTQSISDPLARFGKAGMWLRFFTNGHPGTNAAGALTVPTAPVAVGYQIIRRFSATNSANTLSQGYLLHRAEARPAASGGRPGVLESGFNITSAAYTTGTTNNNGTNPSDPRSIQVPGTNSGATRILDAVIADNVIDFGVRAYVRDAAQPGGLRLVFPADSAGRPSGNANSRYRATLPSDTPVTSTNFSSLFPDVIDITVRLLTDEGATQIANIEKVQTPALTVPVKYNSNAQQWWWGLAQENSRIYTRRVVLTAKPL